MNENIIKVLLKNNLLTEEQLTSIRKKQKTTQHSFFRTFIESSIAKEEELLKTLSKVAHIPIITLTKSEIDSAALRYLSYEMAQRYMAFPVRVHEGALILAISDPFNVIALDDIRIVSGLPVRPVLSPLKEIERCIEEYYKPLHRSMRALLQEVGDDARVAKIERYDAQDVFDRNAFLDLKEVGIENSEVIKLTNIILGDALKIEATDIHIEPKMNCIDVRYRKDGTLRSAMKIPKRYHRRLVARFKILTDMDIAESRSPQDGRTSVLVNNRKIDARLSTIPTFYGEKVAIRLLDIEKNRITLESIGFSEYESKVFIESVSKSQGIILITGPTGSGKTTTLYAGLNYIKSEAKNISTIEDPIEYLVDGFNQMQVNPKKGLTFATGLRSILRQDPNVILVGEIRDQETAEIAFRASLTGHLVFSTLHTNNSISSVTRLLDIGLEHYLISSSLLLVVAQRLIRLNCPYCTEEYTPHDVFLDKFKAYFKEFKVEKFHKGKGCKECDSTGYAGRMAIFEMLRVTDKIRYLIAKKTDEHAIYGAAVENGLRPLIASGFEKVALGLTTLEEVARVADTIDFAASSESEGEEGGNGHLH